MIRLRAGGLLAWDTLVVLLTNRDAGVCADSLGRLLTCERREQHGGRHAMLTKREAAVWGKR